MNTLSPAKIQSRLFILAGVFVTFYSAGLSLAPVIRLVTPDEQLAWLHWSAWFIWIIFSFLVHKYSFRYLPKHDPYLLPASFLLCGWGIFTIFRLFPYYGLRQTAWFSIAAIILLFGFRLPLDLSFLRRYKYLWLTFGLVLTALTVFFGTNPSGFSEQRLWLGCCGLYFQPSEPLKLLLIVYLSAYLADRFLVSKGIRPSASISGSLFTILAPTLFMTGVAILLLIIQRDLGTAFIFIFLYAAIILTATGEWKVLLAAIISISMASIVGYGLFDVVRIRFESWINPWMDPSGRSYQIIQSLIAIVNGDILGRGPGMGNPSLVPVPHSDFIFASITEEMGLLGAVGLLLIIALVMTRGITIAINASGNFRRYLAAGLTVYLVAQSLLIIGGNIRMVPLTGVTLPFVSYGGSSLVVSFIAILLLLLISNADRKDTPPLLNPGPYLLISGFLLALIVIAIGIITWWTFVRSSDLLSRTDNARRTIANQFAQRGSILDRDYRSLITSQKTANNAGNFIRWIDYPELSCINGYTHPVFGQAGVEFTMDTYQEESIQSKYLRQKV